ncbi:MAG: MBL fold metallo-hydrolase [Bacteroidota bacterium]
MKIAFHGAARTVTGSKHLLHINASKSVLLDCGMFQGMGRDTLSLNRNWGFEPTEVTYVILSHAHIDHAGLLPKLVKDGYKGKIYCTPQTRELARLLLRDSARIQEADVRHVNKNNKREGKPIVEPLYTEEDAQTVYDRMIGVRYNELYKIDDGLQLQFTDCGHILGSAAVNLVITEKGKETTVTFSGDVGRYGDMLLRSPSPFPQADYLIMESTYGNKLHDLNTTSADVLLKHVTDTCLRKSGKLIIPAFSVGRTQEILYVLNRLETEGRLPPVKYYVDSPLSTEATNLVKQHPECFNREVQHLLRTDNDVFDFKGLHFTETVEESKALTASDEPCVIISASGMAEAGRIKHHIAGNIADAKNTILLVGYCEPNSLGGRIRNGNRHVTIFGKPYDVLAEVGVIDSMSAHGDYEDLLQWLGCQDKREISKLFLVHGEYESQLAFRQRLIKKGFKDIEIPDLHQEIGLGI